MKTLKLAFFVLLLTFFALGAFGQDQGKTKGRGSDLRTVRGTVVDKDEATVDSAVVYLKNSHSQDITTHVSGDDGRFSFSGLDLNVDYEIHAELNGMTSTSRSVSHFDGRKEFVVTLKLDRKKAEK
jgi:hypothetical protein